MTFELQAELQANNIDITIEQWRILFYLWKEDGINQRELATIANKEKSTLTRQISALEAKDLIFRSAKGTDKRNKYIYLTPMGKALKDKALLASNTVVEKAQKNVTLQEVEAMNATLLKIINNLSV